MNMGSPRIITTHTAWMVGVRRGGVTNHRNKVGVRIGGVTNHRDNEDKEGGVTNHRHGGGN